MILPAQEGLGMRSLNQHGIPFTCVPWQQLDIVGDAPPGTYRSRGSDPQFRQVCRLAPGWVRIRFKMSSPARARAEIRVDTGAGLDDAECVERVSFCGALERDFYLRLTCPVFGFRLDPLDMEGQFHLETFEVRPVSRLALLRHAFLSALRPGTSSRRPMASLSHGWRALRTGRWAVLKQQLLSSVSGPSALAPPPYDAQAAYHAWRLKRQVTAANRQRMRIAAAAMIDAPLLSILLPVSNQPASFVRETLASVLRQPYPRWDLYLVGRGATGARLSEILERLAPGDARIYIVASDTDQRDSLPLNAVLATATGRYVLLLDAGDELADDALYRLAEEVVADSQADMLYSDEDLLGPDRARCRPFFKPDWSPDYLLSCSYTGRLAAYRTSLVRELGGFRAEVAPAHDHDLALRFAVRGARVRHLAAVLYHRRDPGNQTPTSALAESQRRALAAYLNGIGHAGSIEPGPTPALHRLRLAVTDRRLVSIIIPTAYQAVTVRGEVTTYLARCLASIRNRTTYPNYEIVLLDNGRAPADLDLSMHHRKITRQVYALPFNWAAAMNQGAARAKGSHLLFLDDDTEVLTPDWIESLLEFSQLPEIGAVGARLQFPDGRLQHSGVTILDGVPGHPFYGEPATHPGYYFSNLVPRNYSAVTGACLMTGAEVFRQLGGFDDHFGTNFNDIDYCLRVGVSGRRVVCTPYARLIHYETATKRDFSPAEFEAFTERWRRLCPRDPFSNPNLSTRFHDFRIESE
jgi:GT2 family glycosyltransferase